MPAEPTDPHAHDASESPDVPVSVARRRLTPAQKGDRDLTVWLLVGCVIMGGFAFIATALVGWGVADSCGGGCQGDGLDTGASIATFGPAAVGLVTLFVAPLRLGEKKPAAWIAGGGLSLMFLVRVVGYSILKPVPGS